MGCWNDTCGLTQLPIQIWDEIVLFILYKQDSEHADVYKDIYHATNDLWIPILIPIEGTYDDYGSIEDINLDDQKTKLIVDFLKKHWLSKHSAENLTFPEILELISHGKVEISNFMRQPTRISTVLMHKEIFSALKSHNIISHDKHPGYDKDIYQENREFLMRELELCYNKYLPLFNKNETDKSKLIMTEFAANDEWIFNDFHNKNMFNDYIVRLIFDELYNKTPYENVKWLMNIIADAYTIDDNMHAARKMWLPQGGKGSQEVNFNIQQAILLATKKIIDEKGLEDEAVGFDDCFDDDKIKCNDKLGVKYCVVCDKVATFRNKYTQQHFCYEHNTDEHNSMIIKENNK